MFVYGFWLLWNLAAREMSASVLSVFLAVLALVRLVQLIRETRSLPPGPWGLPIVGSLPFLKGDLHLHYRDLTKQYGSLFSTRLGSQLIVVLSDYKTIRDAFRKEEFTGRPTTEVINTLEGYGKSRYVWLSPQNCLVQKSATFKRSKKSDSSLSSANFLHPVSTIYAALSFFLIRSLVTCGSVITRHGRSPDENFPQHILVGGILFFSKLHWIPWIKFRGNLQKTLNHTTHISHAPI